MATQRTLVPGDSTVLLIRLREASYAMGADRAPDLTAEDLDAAIEAIEDSSGADEIASLESKLEASEEQSAQFERERDRARAERDNRQRKVDELAAQLSDARECLDTETAQFAIDLDRARRRSGDDAIAIVHQARQLSAWTCPCEPCKSLRLRSGEALLTPASAERAS